MTAKPLIPRRYIVKGIRVIDTTTGQPVGKYAHEKSAEARARKLNREERSK